MTRNDQSVTTSGDIDHEREATAKAPQRTHVADRTSRAERGGWRPLAPIRAALLAVLGLCMLSPSPARAQPVEWTQRVVSGPSARYRHAMAYDAARGVTVLFGGYSGSGRIGDTWEWNGTAWTQRSISGPSPRSSHAMAYDTARGVTVLFGGYAGSSANGETWEWNGTAWTQRAVSGPSRRYGHAMAYDTARGVTVLFGGWEGSVRNSETWEWGGSGWTRRTVSGPSPRFGHAMAYDAARGVTVLFGGFAGGEDDETWEWNGTTWSQRTVSGPTPRRKHAMDYDASRGVTVLFGGYTGSYNSETWEWNGTAWSQRTVSGPTPRQDHAMAYDAARGVTVLFGGETRGFSGQTWELGLADGPPFIITQPDAQTICAGGSASFTLNAVGAGLLTYQWRKDTSVLVDEPNHISGATAATLVIVNTTESDEGSYDCIVSNDFGSVESDAATLSVCDYLADLDCDGEVDISDLAILLSNFGRTDSPPRSDGNLDGDETVGLADLGILLAGFGAVCP
ncbi:MAG: immunoglobulin domain-containing protein [Planctomycetes bacterium]|nr:immunoglobulin domain-containing protein [Planctomycetota bacterium]